jgi:hypothetical protein
MYEVVGGVGEASVECLNLVFVGGLHSGVF